MNEENYLDIFLFYFFASMTMSISKGTFAFVFTSVFTVYILQQYIIMHKLLAYIT